VWSFLVLFLVSSCDEKIIEEENFIEASYETDSITIFKKDTSIKASDISSTTTDDLFVNRDFCVGETNLYVINNVDNNWAVEVFDRSSLMHKSTLKTWVEDGETKSFTDGMIYHVSESKGRLYVTHKSQVHIFDSNSFEFIARAGTGKWSTEESITFTNGFAALSYKDKLFVRDRRNIVVFNESDLIKDKAQSEIKVVARTKTGVLSDAKNSLVSMVTNNDLVYLTDQRNKKIYVIDPESVVASEEIPVLREISLNKKPLSITFFKNEIYILCNKGQLLIYDIESLEQVDQIFGIDQYLFESSINKFGIFAHGDEQSQIFINDMENKEIVVGLVENVKIKLYE